MKGEKVPIYGDGLNVRDWIHVRDHAKALLLLLEKGNPGEVYNIGSDNERNNKEITQMILKILGKGEEMIEYVKDRPGHDRRYGIDASKILALGWQPDYPREKFEAGLHETIQWYLENTQWVEHLWERKEEMNAWNQDFFKPEKK
jgi:dTDP-glucose 4,6-dehydratase